MQGLISQGKISAVIYESMAEITASYVIAPPFDREYLLPYIPKGVILDFKVLCEGKPVCESKMVNVREFNGTWKNNSVMLSRRLDGAVVLKLCDVKQNEPLEISVVSASFLENRDNAFELVFPKGYGDSIFGEIAVTLLKDSIKAVSPTHNFSGGKSAFSLRVDFNEKDLVLRLSDTDESSSVLISRRLFEDNIAFCTFGFEKQSEIGHLEPLGGVHSLLTGCDFGNNRGKRVHCFITHSVLPPKGVAVYDKYGNFIDEIMFDRVLTSSRFRPIEALYARGIIKSLENEFETALPEERCLIREKINDICFKYKIIGGDMAFTCIELEKARFSSLEQGNRLCEEDKVRFSEAEAKILSSQTVDGVIADGELPEDNAKVMSTAVCLIVLYLYTKKKYKNFAKRSLAFLSDKSGYWADTAKKVWSGGLVDFDELVKRSDMKIMYRRVDEMAVSLIKNYRRKKNDCNRM